MWKRKGGQAGYEDLPLHAAALHELQGLPLPEEGEERGQGGFFDQLPVSEAEKSEISNALGNVALAGVQVRAL